MSPGENFHDIRIIGFQGIGTLGIRPDLREEHGLLKLGHVGISLDGGQTIYGFSPSDSVILELGEQEIFRILLYGGAVWGQIRDDTAHMKRAYELFVIGVNKYTQVWQQIHVVSPEFYKQVENNLQKQLIESPVPLWYKLPSGRDQPMPLQCNNCATWIRTLGLVLPETTGILKLYIDALAEHGTLWTPINR